MNSFGRGRARAKEPVSKMLSCEPIQIPDDTSDKFSFRVKGGLVIEFCFRVCLNDGLGSFVGRPIFIFSPSPLGSA